MAYFPLFFDLEEKWVLVVGAGSVASRRIRVLLEFGARVAAVAPESSFLEGAAGEKDKRLLVLIQCRRKGSRRRRELILSVCTGLGERMRCFGKGCSLHPPPHFFW